LSDVQAPAVGMPTDEEFYSKQDPTKPDIAFLKNHFYREGRITEKQALHIINTGTEILKKESNLLEVDAPITGRHCKRVERFFLGIIKEYTQVVTVLLNYPLDAVYS
jgi:hypothetical protein